MEKQTEVVDEPVHVVPYDPEWPSRFDAEKALSSGRLVHGSPTASITSAAGLAAKPVIDILVDVSDLPTSRACLRALPALDYQYAPYRASENALRVAPITSISSQEAHAATARSLPPAISCALVQT